MRHSNGCCNGSGGATPGCCGETGGAQRCGRLRDVKKGMIGWSARVPERMLRIAYCEATRMLSVWRFANRQELSGNGRVKEQSDA